MIVLKIDSITFRKEKMLEVGLPEDDSDLRQTYLSKSCFQAEILISENKGKKEENVYFFI